MRTVLRSLLIALLIVSLVEAPVLASPAPVAPCGMVLQAERARVGAGEAAAGATLYDGDVLETSRGGTLRAQVGAAQLYLLADSAAALRQGAVGAGVVLKRGTVVLSSAGGGAFELQASEARIRPQTAQPTLAQVSLVGPYELLVTSQRGPLEVRIDEEMHTVPEATSYRVLIEPEAQGPRGAGAGEVGRSQGSGQPPVKAARSRFLQVALITISVATGIIVWRALISDENP